MAIDLTKKVTGAVSNSVNNYVKNTVNVNTVASQATTALNTINTFSDLSPQVGQLKTSLSISQKSQLDALSGVTGIAGSAGNITGNLTNPLAGVDNTTASVINVSSALSSALSAAGLSTDTIKGLITNKVSSAVTNKLPIDQVSSATPTDLGKLINRLPKAGKNNPVKEIEKAKEALLGIADFNYAGIAFPSDVTSQAKSWIELEFYKYTRDNAFSPGNLGKSTKVILPLPKQLMEMFSVNYEAKDYGVLTGGILKAGGDATGTLLQKVGATVDQAMAGTLGQSEKGPSFSQAVSDFAGDVGSDEVKDVSKAKGLDLLTSALASTGNEGLAGLADQVAGGVPNPHSTVFFKGVNLRTFTWNWHLVPLSESDALVMRSVVNYLKRATLPKIEGAILRYPDFVMPKIGGQNAIDMKFKRCMIGDLGIDYAPDAQAYHDDGAPVSLNLSITFKETEIFTEDDV